MTPAWSTGVTPALALLIGLLSVSIPDVALATEDSSQSDGTYDESFETGLGLNGTPDWASVDADGRILLTGLFTTVDGAAANRIVRLLADGTRDTSFNVGTGLGAPAGTTPLGSFIETLSDELNGGKILVSGNFTTYNGAPAIRIMRLLSNGQLDTSFNPPATSNTSVVRTLAVLTDGSILAGGNFSTPTGRLMKLSRDGSAETLFNEALGSGFNDEVWSIATQSNGQILVGGAFTSFDGVSVTRLVRLNADGSRDPSFPTNLGTISNGVVRAIHVQSDGKILVGGHFTGGLIRLNSDGSVDSSFASTRGTGFNAVVASLEPGRHGQVYASGNFETYNGVSAVRVARLNADGSLDMTFTTGTGPSAWTARAIPLDGGDVIIAGSFQSYDGRLSTSDDPKPIRIARLTSMSLTPTSQTVTADVNQSVTTQTLGAVANSTVTYSISPALPAGFSLNASTGVVSGQSSDFVPAADYTITGTDAAGRTATVSLTLGMPPTPPASQSSRSGSSRGADLEGAEAQPALATTGGSSVLILLAGSLLAGIGLTLARRQPPQPAARR